jgi:hypothetical protein
MPGKMIYGIGVTVFLGSVFGMLVCGVFMPLCPALCIPLGFTFGVVGMAAWGGAWMLLV